MGVFIIISAVLILVTLFYVIEKKGVFEAQSHYKLLAKDAEDIAEGMPILFSGFEIGQVDRLSLYDNGEVLIIISIPRHNTKWVRSNSVFTLEKPLIGKPKITLTSSMKSPPLDEKVITRMRIKDGINEIITNIQPVVSELQNIVKNANILTASLSDHNASFQTSLVHLEKFSDRLADSPDLLHTMTGNTQSAVKFHEAITKLDLALEDMRSLVQNTDQGISEIRRDIISPANANMQELQLIFKDINAKLKTIDNTVKVIGQSDKEIAFLKDEMRVWLEEVTELSTRVNAMIGEDPQESITLP